MKKFYLATLCAVVLLSGGCSDSSINSTITESETITEATVETGKDTLDESISDESTINSSGNIAEIDNPIELPNKEGLTHALAEAFVSIGLDAVPPLEFKNYENISGTISVDVYTKTEKCNLLFACFYIDITDSWNIVSVKNSDNQHTYWVQKGLENKVDLYDYNTDTLVSAKSETFSSDPVGDFESQAESINDDFEEVLESIADKYQIETKQD